jgi:hypothetical protein
MGTNIIKHRFNWHILYSVLLGFIIFSAFFIRYTNIDTHFTHVDDLLAAHFLPVDASHNIASVLKYADTIAKQTTYAPLQFIFTACSADNTMGYKEILYRTRLPSFLIAMLSFGIIIMIYRLLYKDEFLMFALLPVTILAFSWEHIIYSIQSSCYALSLFAVLVNFLLFFSIVNKKDVTKGEAFSLGIILATLSYAHYQFLLFLPGFFIALALKYRFSWYRFFKHYYLSFVVLAPALFVLYRRYLVFVIDRGLNWNVGTKFEFVFTLAGHNKVVDKVVHIFSFFSRNIYYVFKHIISFGLEHSLINHIFAVLFIMLFFVGIISWVRSSNGSKRYFTYFFFITAVIWVMLVVLGKIALSPTRHSLALLGFILIFTPAGFELLISRLKKDTLVRRILVLCLPLMILVLFFINARTVMDKRTDKFDHKIVNGLIMDYNVDEIFAYDWTWNLNFMDCVKNNFEQVGSNVRDIYFYKKEGQKEGVVLFVTHRGGQCNNDVKKRFLSICQRPLNVRMSELYKKELFSNTEICFGDQTKNGANSLLLYIMKIKEK